MFWCIFFVGPHRVMMSWCLPVEGGFSTAFIVFLFMPFSDAQPPPHMGQPCAKQHKVVDKACIPQLLAVVHPTQTYVVPRVFWFFLDDACLTPASLSFSESFWRNLHQQLVQNWHLGCCTGQ